MKDMNSKKREEAVERLNESIRIYNDALKKEAYRQRISDEAEKCIRELRIVQKILNVDNIEEKSDFYTVAKYSIDPEYKELFADNFCLSVLNYKLRCGLQEAGQNLIGLITKIKSHKEGYKSDGQEHYSVSAEIQICFEEGALKDNPNPSPLSLTQNKPSFVCPCDFILNHISAKDIAQILFKEFIKREFPSDMTLILTCNGDPIKKLIPTVCFHELFSDEEVMNEIQALCKQYCVTSYKDPIKLDFNLEKVNEEDFFALSMEMLKDARLPW